MCIKSWLGEEQKGYNLKSSNEQATQWRQNVEEASELLVGSALRGVRAGATEGSSGPSGWKDRGRWDAGAASHWLPPPRPFSVCV